MGISKELKRYVTGATGVVVLMLVASVPAFSQYRYDRSRSVNRRGSILGQIFRRSEVRRRPAVYGRSNRYYRSNHNQSYYRRNTNWRGNSYGNSYGYNNYHRRSERNRWRGRDARHSRSYGRGGYRNW